MNGRMQKGRFLNHFVLVEITIVKLYYKNGPLTFYFLKIYKAPKISQSIFEVEIMKNL